MDRSKVIIQGKLIAVVHNETSSLLAEFENKNQYISVCSIYEEDKSIEFDKILKIHILVSYDQKISLIFDVKSGFHIRLVFTQRRYSLQYKKCVHLWNNFPCIITLDRMNF